MSITATQPVTTPIPVQLSRIGSYRVCSILSDAQARTEKKKEKIRKLVSTIAFLIHIVLSRGCNGSAYLYTNVHGKAAIHYTTIYKVSCGWGVN